MQASRTFEEEELRRRVGEFQSRRQRLVEHQGKMTEVSAEVRGRGGRGSLHA